MKIKLSQINLKLHEQDLEVVDCFRNLGIWFDERSLWKVSTEKVAGESKKIVNIIRCLKGRDWRAYRLKTVYISV